MYDPQSRWFQSQAQPRRQRQFAGNRKHPILPPLALELLEDRTSPAVFNVNTTVDLLNPGPGLVTLRSAIQAARSGNNTINLTVPGNYQITLVGTAGENDNAAGEFAIMPSAGGSLAIVNTSGGTVTVDGNHLARVFDINPLNSTPTDFTVTMQGFTIQNGLVDGPGQQNGAGIQVQGIVSLTLNNMTVTNNDAASGSGGGIDDYGALLAINGSTIGNNLAGNNGGAVDNAAGSVSIFDSIVANNVANLTGGGYSSYGAGSLGVTNSLFTANSAVNSGGGIFVGGSTLNIMSSTISANTTAGNGGGIELESTGTGFAGSTITNTTITGNIALSSGGSNIGGGIDAPAAFTGSVALVYDTINGNSATGGGGVYLGATSVGLITIQNTIIAQNNATNGPDANSAVGATMASDLGHNVIGVALPMTFPNKTTKNGAASNPLNPLLGPLQNNGGPTIGASSSQMTLPTEALLPGSPAIGAAAPVSTATDERGSPRPAMQPDSGAYQTLTGPQAYVEYLYTNFLHRMGNLNAANAAGFWVTAITTGQITEAGAANAIARSPEALGDVVNGLYTKLLNRTADSAGLSFWVNFMQGGGTEEQVIIGILSSTEYGNLESTPMAFVTSLYTNLMGRTGSPSEVGYWVKLVPSEGNVAVASAFVSSLEYRSFEVQQLYGFSPAPTQSLANQLPNLLHRQLAPTAGEIIGWVGSPLDILSIQVAIATSPEAMAYATANTDGNLG